MGIDTRFVNKLNQTIRMKFLILTSKLNDVGSEFIRFPFVKRCES